MIYLDNAATTFPKPEVVYNTMNDFLRYSCVNPGRGSYEKARNAMELIEDTRILLSDLVHDKGNYDVIFMPSATIAINQVLNGLDWEKIRNVFITPFEHNAIMRTLHEMSKRYNFEVTVLPFDTKSFQLDIDKSEILFAEKQPELLLMSHVSNVLGLIIPIEKISNMCRKYNKQSNIMIDASQSLGLVEMDVNKIDCDFIIFAGHKSLYGPLGIGGIIMKKSIKLKTFIFGGTGSDSLNLDMPNDSYLRYESGSQNIYAISGLNAGIKWILQQGIENIFSHEKELTRYLVSELKKLKGIEMYVPQDDDSHIAVTSLNIKGYTAEDIGNILDQDFNIAVRTGHHCAPFISRFLDGKNIYSIHENINSGYGTVRISLGFFNRKEDIDRLVNAFNDILEG